MSNKKIISREEVLGGMLGRPTKQAHTLLALIENRTALLVAQSRQLLTHLPTEEAVERGHQAFLEAIALGREPPVQPTIQDLERFAPHWGPTLVPDNPSLRAAVAHLLGQKYDFTFQSVLKLRAALGLDEQEVQHAYQNLYGTSLTIIFVPQMRLVDRLRWAWAVFDGWLENLPPFWIAFIFSLPVGGITLALPIAVADVGPLPGLALLIILGIINILTVIGMAEAVARNGSIRYGNAFFGQIVNDYLGRIGSIILSLVLAAFSVGLLLVFYIGISTTLESISPIPAEIWAGLVLLVGLYFLTRGSFNATVGTIMLLQTVNIGLILLLSVFTFTQVQAENLLYMNVPLLNGLPFEPAFLQLIFGVVIGVFFSHMGVGYLAKPLLRRDPSARSLILGHAAGIVFLIIFNGIWILAVNGAIAPQTLASQTGTVLVPLAAQLGPGVQVIGTVFALLSMGIASIFFSLSLFNLVQERLPLQQQPISEGNSDDAGLATGNDSSQISERSTFLSRRGRLFLSMSPVVIVFLIAEWLFLTDRGSFAGLLGFLGVVTTTLAAGIFPALMLVASRRKGEHLPAVVYRFVGNPVLIVFIYLLFLGSLFIHGLIIWKNPVAQAGALLAGILMIAATLAMIRRGVFTPRMVMELREEGEQGSFAITAIGQAMAAVVHLGYPDDEQQVKAARGKIPSFSSLRYVTFHLPATQAQELKVWVHKTTPEGESEGLPAFAVIHAGHQKREFDLKLSAGQIVLPLTGKACRLEITLDHE